MLGQLLRVVAGVVVTYMAREALRLILSSKRDAVQTASPQSSARTSRIHIDRKNIVDAKFEDLSDQNTKP